MYTIKEPLTEEEILAVTSEDATGEEIKVDMETKAECCVDHLCGCK
jgi:hypothetical protein